MENIANRLGRPTISEKPNHPYKGAPEFWHTYELSKEKRAALFAENWEKAGGHVFRLADMAEVKQFIKERGEEMQARRIVRQNQPELHLLGLEDALPDTEIVVWHTGDNEKLLSYAAGADIGITVVNHAAAHTGSIVVTSSPDQGRSVSLLPTVLIAIIPVDRIQTRLGEVLAHFDGRPREEFPAGIHFISGPSRSADIENDLTIGVHGPG
ncbi:lactate utilization protein, partial [Microbacteriaceae bacterium K1510]|nr:lactate utilization protein [Microbacteriaceae bacterium K1510]